MFAIGADPEVFVGKNGKFVSAHSMVEGTKLKPFPVVDGAVQVDGMALEFNIDPAFTREDFINKIEHVKNQLLSMVSGEYEFLKDCSVFFEDKDVVSVPKYNLELGCSADYNGYDFRENPKPNAKMNMRTAGGHIHIGIAETDRVFRAKHFKMAGYLARAMDKYVGIYSLIWDKDDSRRSLYGQAGAFRPKKYGMEYRTLSNAWIFSKDIMSFIYDQTEKAVANYLDGERIEDTMYANIINNSDRTHYLLNTDEAELVKDMVYG